MQAFGTFSFLLCVACMYCIYNGWERMADVIFAMSLISLLISLVISIVEIWLSTRALETLLSDVEELEDGNLIRKMFGKE
jgi:signal transduction histidine kinase